MTSIDTREAKKHWGDETKYLEKIQYVALGEDKNSISLLGDEEGNYETILTRDAAVWVAKKLIAAIETIDGRRK